MQLLDHDPRIVETVKPVSFGRFLSDHFSEQIDSAAGYIDMFQKDVAVELLELLDDDGEVKTGTPPGIRKLCETLRDRILADAGRAGVEIR